MNRWGYRLYYLSDANEIIAERGLGSPNETAAAIDGARLARESAQRFPKWRVVRYEQTEQTIAEGFHVDVNDELPGREEIEDAVRGTPYGEVLEDLGGQVTLEDPD
jgi:hypothetical protein